VASIIKNEVPSMDAIPVIHRFIGNANFDRTVGDFYKNKDAVTVMKEILSGEKKNENDSDQKQWRQEVKIFNGFEKKIKHLKDKQKRGTDVYGNELTQEQREDIDKQIQLLMKETNNSLE
jgi:hypothetical protein